MGIDLFQHGFYIIETTGVIGFALSGIILAKHKNFDIVGVYIVAWATAFGGGTLRDVILDIQPVYWIVHAEYPLILFFVVLLISLFKRLKIQSSWIFLPDTLGLATFSITTAQSAYEEGYSLVIVGILSTVVATFGGVVRDIFCQEIPMIFKRGTVMYASIAFVGACVYVLLATHVFLNTALCMYISIAFIFLFRLMAMRFKWVLSL